MPSASAPPCSWRSSPCSYGGRAPALFSAAPCLSISLAASLPRELLLAHPAPRACSSWCWPPSSFSGARSTASLIFFPAAPQLGSPSPMARGLPARRAPGTSYGALAPWLAARPSSLLSPTSQRALLLFPSREVPWRALQPGRPHLIPFLELALAPSCSPARALCSTISSSPRTAFRSLLDRAPGSSRARPLAPLLTARQISLPCGSSSRAHPLLLLLAAPSSSLPCQSSSPSRF